HYQTMNAQAISGMTTIVNSFGQGLLTMGQQVQAFFQRFTPSAATKAQGSAAIGPQLNTPGANYIPPRGNVFTDIPFQFLPQSTPQRTAPQPAPAAAGAGGNTF